MHIKLKKKNDIKPYIKPIWNANSTITDMAPLPSQTFDFMFGNVLQSVLRLCGAGVLVHGFRPNISTVVYGLVIAFGIVCQFYTIFFMGSFYRLVCLPTMFVVPQGIMKFYVYLRNADYMADQVQMLRRFYRQCEGVASCDAHGQNTYHPEMPIVLRWINYFKLMIVLFITMVVVCSLVCIAYPAMVFIVDGRIEFALYIFVPFVPNDTTQGVIANWVAQLLLLSATAAGLICADLVMVLLILHICTMSDVLCGKLTLMSGVLDGRRLENRNRETAAGHEFLCQCIRLHQDFGTYLNGLADVFFTTFTAEVSTNFVSMCVTLLALMQLSFFPLYSYMVLFMVKTFLVCTLGTVVDIYVGDVEGWMLGMDLVLMSRHIVIGESCVFRI